MSLRSRAKDAAAALLPVTLRRRRGLAAALISVVLHALALVVLPAVLPGELPAPEKDPDSFRVDLHASPGRGGEEQAPADDRRLLEPGTGSPAASERTELPDNDSPEPAESDSREPSDNDSPELPESQRAPERSAEPVIADRRETTSRESSQSGQDATPQTRETTSPHGPQPRSRHGPASEPEPPAVTRPQPGSPIEPEYPRAARRRGEEGVVHLTATIDSRGEVGDVRVRDNAGSASLAHAAVRAVENTRFEPGTVEHQPIKMDVDIRVRFALVD